MPRTAPSYPRRELLRARRAWLGSRGRPLLAYVAAVALLLTVFVVSQAPLVGLDIPSMLLGVLVGGVAVALGALVQVGHLLSEPRAIHHLRGATGEDATRTELGIARRRRLVWDWVGSLPLVPQTELLREVWGPAYDRQTIYLRVHLASIRRKLEPEPGHPRLFVTEPGIGYRFAPQQ